MEAKDIFRGVHHDLKFTLGCQQTNGPGDIQHSGMNQNGKITVYRFVWFDCDGIVPVRDATMTP